MNEFLPLTNTNQHELAVRKIFLTFKFYENKKEHEGFSINIGVKVRGRTVQPKPKARPTVCGTFRVVRGYLLPS